MPDASVSAHVDEEFLGTFDETFDCGPGRPNSRSEAIEHAMRWAVAMEDARRSAGWEYESWRETRVGTSFVFQLAAEFDRRQADP